MSKLKLLNVAKGIINIILITFILLNIIKFRNINLIKGKCYYNNIIKKICANNKMYYIVNCSFTNNNYSTCVSNNYIEKDIDCYLCNIKDNIYYIENTYCSLTNFIDIISSYLIIILLLNIIFNLLLMRIKRKGKKENIIKKLFYNKINLQNDDTCSICLTNFNDNSDNSNNKYEYIIKTNCKPIGHCFCYPCAKIWFKNNISCPYCRQIIIELIK
jgi:hypothetical protein